MSKTIDKIKDIKPEITLVYTESSDRIIIDSSDIFDITGDYYKFEFTDDYDEDLNQINSDLRNLKINLDFNNIETFDDIKKEFISKIKDQELDIWFETDLVIKLKP